MTTKCCYGITDIISCYWDKDMIDNIIKYNKENVTVSKIQDSVAPVCSPLLIKQVTVNRGPNNDIKKYYFNIMIKSRAFEYFWRGFLNHTNLADVLICSVITVSACLNKSILCSHIDYQYLLSHDL